MVLSPNRAGLMITFVMSPGPGILHSPAIWLDFDIGPHVMLVPL